MEFLTKDLSFSLVTTMPLLGGHGEPTRARFLSRWVLIVSLTTLRVAGLAKCCIWSYLSFSYPSWLMHIRLCAAQNHASQNERDHITSDFTVPAPDHTHGKRHFGAGVQEDHIGTRDGYLVADAPTTTESRHGKQIFGDRNIDHVRGIVGS